MWPLHTWLPDAHTAAPTVGSVLLAGVLLKMGTYGFVRILLPVVPEGAEAVAPYLGAFAVVGIVYGSLACLAQTRPQAPDRLLLGRPHGLRAPRHRDADPGRGQRRALRQHRPRPDHRPALLPRRRAQGPAPHRRRSRPRRRPLRAEPRLGGLLAFAAVACLGLPGLAGFWGEMLALFGAFDPADGLNRAVLPRADGARRRRRRPHRRLLRHVLRRVVQGAASRPGGTRSSCAT